MTESRAPSIYPWMVVFILLIIYACAFIDRQILSLLAPAISKDFKLSDLQTGLLLGPAFAIVFVFSGMYFGRIADRANRSRMIRWSLAAWSVCTAACGLSPSFPWLFAMRMGVGIGEATIAPAGVSLIGDVMPPAQRTRGLAFFNAGSNVGTASSYLIGAAIIPAAPVLLPLVGELQPWQAAFVYVGLPGLLLALVAMVVREPKRFEKVADNSDLARRFLRERISLFAPLFAGSTAIICIGYGTAAWLPSYLGRTYQWSTSRIGFTVGAQNLTVMIVATVIATFIVGAFRKRGNVDAVLRTMILFAALIVPPAILSWQMGDADLFMLLYALELFCQSSVLNLVGAAICDVAPNQWRAKLYAIYLMVSSLVGLGLGPPVIGFLAQHFYGGNLGDAVSTYNAIVAPCGIVFLLMARKAFKAGALEARTWQQ